MLLYRKVNARVGYVALGIAVLFFFVIVYYAYQAYDHIDSVIEEPAQFQSEI
jgi:hypothetical protein